MLELVGLGEIAALLGGGGRHRLTQGLHDLNVCGNNVQAFAMEGMILDE